MRAAKALRYQSNILVFDTSRPHCAAALIGDCDIVYEETTLPMARGQADNLMPLLEDTLAKHGLAWTNLDAIGVGIGPGNFTGIRISVATARGLSMALGIPAVGVSTFEAMLYWNQGPFSEPALVISLEAPRGMAYVQHFRYGRPQAAPRLIDPADPPMVPDIPVNMTVAGFRAAEIARPLGARFQETEPTELIRNLAKFAGEKYLKHKQNLAPPAPLYIRPADADPPRDPSPVILDQ